MSTESNLHIELKAQAYTLSANANPSQADLRRAVSSAYYAIFHLLSFSACDFFCQNAMMTTQMSCSMRRVFVHGKMKEICKGKFSGVGGNFHRFVQPLTTTPISKDLNLVTTTFVDLQEARHRADYDLTAAADFTQNGVLVMLCALDQSFVAWATEKTTQNGEALMFALLHQQSFKG